MSDSFNFREFKEIEQKIRNISKRIKSLEKERDDLRLKKAMENYFNAKYSDLKIFYCKISNYKL